MPRNKVNPISPWSDHVSTLVPYDAQSQVYLRPDIRTSAFGTCIWLLPQRYHFYSHSGDMGGPMLLSFLVLPKHHRALGLCLWNSICGQQLGYLSQHSGPWHHLDGEIACVGGSRGGSGKRLPQTMIRGDKSSLTSGGSSPIQGWFFGGPSFVEQALLCLSLCSLVLMAALMPPKTAAPANAGSQVPYAWGPTAQTLFGLTAHKAAARAIIGCDQLDTGTGSPSGGVDACWSQSQKG